MPVYFSVVMNESEELENILGVKFDKKDILQLALTHKSYSSKNNDRLEFLGDTILNFTISNYLFDKFHNASSGDLSRLKGYIVSQDYLLIIAKKLELNKFILLGKGELLSDGNYKPSILSSALEAIIAAIYISNGFNEAKHFILNHFNLESIPFETDKNFKGKLQTITLKRYGVLPEYKTYRSGNKYISEVSVIEKFLSKGEGSSKKSAENSAAVKALKILKTT